MIDTRPSSFGNDIVSLDRLLLLGIESLATACRVFTVNPGINAIYRRVQLARPAHVAVEIHQCGSRSDCGSPLLAPRVERWAVVLQGFHERYRTPQPLPIDHLGTVRASASPTAVVRGDTRCAARCRLFLITRSGLTWTRGGSWRIPSAPSQRAQGSWVSLSFLELLLDTGMQRLLILFRHQEYYLLLIVADSASP